MIKKDFNTPAWAKTRKLVKHMRQLKTKQFVLNSRKRTKGVKND